MRGGRLPLCPPPRVPRAGRHRSVWPPLAPPDQRLQSFARVTGGGESPNSGAAAHAGAGLRAAGSRCGDEALPAAPWPVAPPKPQARAHAVGRFFWSYTHLSVGANTTFPFRDTGTLTCNDAVFLQGLLPADLERSVQNLCETQMPHSSWSWQLKTVTVNATAPSLSVRSRVGGGVLAGKGGVGQARMPQGPTANARRELGVRKASGRGFVPPPRAGGWRQGARTGSSPPSPRSDLIGGTRREAERQPLAPAPRTRLAATCRAWVRLWALAKPG